LPCNNIFLQCTDKFRSLEFNLKDAKNQQLRGRLFNEELKPYDLVRMTADELANSELVSWREQEKQRSLKDTIRIADLSSLPAGSELSNFIPSDYRNVESKLSTSETPTDSSLDQSGEQKGERNLQDQSNGDGDGDGDGDGEGKEGDEEELLIRRKKKRSRADSNDSEQRSSKPKLVRGSSSAELNYSSFITQEDTPKDATDANLDIPEFEQFEEVSSAKKELEESAREITPESSKSPSPFSGEQIAHVDSADDGLFTKREHSNGGDLEIKAADTALPSGQDVDLSTTAVLKKEDHEPESTTPPYSPPMSVKSMPRLPPTTIKRITVPIERDYLRRTLTMPLVTSLSSKLFEITNRGAKDWEQLLGSTLMVEGRIPPDVVLNYLKQVSTTRIYFILFYFILFFVS
jgi:hypothetical protein